ncbi:SWIM-type domain-containing protein [Mycena sanguinolenta]|uniref:SWIM-type domain-containing protein n=1 Tax=Mycena sanguinolenta TaxID=230812 RepID=A0A8H6Z4U4_9AGAR|nr:SWIM-type domain-containing protein [Mycena sanguinolenta]
MHQHPKIPQNSSDEPYVSAEDIHWRAVKEMYDFCYSRGLSQVWAYLWNRWYTPQQWPLWAQASCDAIPRLKTTMIVESLWRHVKHRDLAQFNRPRLDLVINVVLQSLLPRVKRTLEYVQGLRRIGRPQALAGWQADAKAEWVEKSRTDEHRLVAKELKVLKSAPTTKGRAERLQQIADETAREAGTYATDIGNWVCPCEYFFKSRFLMCKHLIREANKLLDNRPLTDLRFFLDLRRNHFPPYYTIPGIHTLAQPENDEESPQPSEVIVLGVRGSITPMVEEERPGSACTPRPDVSTPNDGCQQDNLAAGVRENEASEGDAGPSETVEKAAGDEVDDSEDPEELVDGDRRVTFAEARRIHLKRCWDEMMDAIDNPRGVHPKLAAVLEGAFTKIGLFLGAAFLSPEVVRIGGSGANNATTPVYRYPPPLAAPMDSRTQSLRAYADPSPNTARDSSSKPKNTCRSTSLSSSRFALTTQIPPAKPQTLPTKPRTVLLREHLVTLKDAGAVCRNLCCDQTLGRPGQFVRTRSEAMHELCLNYCVNSVQIAQIRDEISQLEVSHTAHEQEIQRLESLLAGPPSTNYNVPVAPGKFCAQPCCSLRLGLGASHRVQQVLLQLRRRTQEISQYLNARRCLLTPIHRLPPELLRGVFFFAATSPLDVVIRLARVCNYWRAVALDTSQLWATIRLPISNPQLNFCLSHANSAPLNITCAPGTQPSALKKIARLSLRWRSLDLSIASGSEQLNVIHQRLPLLKSLRLSPCTIEAFRTRPHIFSDAPSLRRLSLDAGYRFLSPSLFSLPWGQITFLTLKCVDFPVFSEFLRQCPHLFYFNVEIVSSAVPTAETESSLRKLVLRGSYCQEAIVGHRFPKLLSLCIDKSMYNQHPNFLAFLARSSRLEMLSVRGLTNTVASWTPSVELLMVTPSLRIILIRDWDSDSRMAMVTPKFLTTPLVAPCVYDPFSPVAPPSLAQVDVAGCTIFDAAALLAFMDARGPSFDPHGIERARVIDPFGEDEPDYLDHV